MPCTEHQKNVWEHRKGFYKQFFHWYGWASTTKPITFFDRPSETQKEIRFFEAFESQSPMGKVALCPNLNV